MEEIYSQSNIKGKAFIDFILNNSELNREELMSLKRKILTMKSSEAAKSEELLKTKSEILISILAKE